MMPLASRTAGLNPMSNRHAPGRGVAERLKLLRVQKPEQCRLGIQRQPGVLSSSCCRSWPGTDARQLLATGVDERGRRRSVARLGASPVRPDDEGGCEPQYVTRSRMDATRALSAAGASSTNACLHSAGSAEPYGGATG